MINTEHLERCIKILEDSYKKIKTFDKESIDYEIYRNSIVKTFEITLEQSYKLLKKKLLKYLPSKKFLDSLSFKDVFRYSNKHSLLDENSINRWFKYRDNRNNTAHDYGENFDNDTLLLIENFIKDVKELKIILNKNDN